MTSLDWSVLTAGLAGGVGVGLIAMTALRRRGTRRSDEYAHVGSKSGRKRIEVVAIDEASGRSPERKENE
jgi:hypothetical protein